MFRKFQVRRIPKASLSVHQRGASRPRRVRASCRHGRDPADKAEGRRKAGDSHSACATGPISPQPLTIQPQVPSASGRLPCSSILEPEGKERESGRGAVMVAYKEVRPHAQQVDEGPVVTERALKSAFAREPSRKK